MAWGDYDNDGWVDLFMPAAESHKRIRDGFALWNNEGGRRFMDHGAAAEAAAGSPLVQASSGSGFGDYDGDGDLDVHVTRGAAVSAWRELDLLLRNDRGVLTNVNRAAGLTDSLPTADAIWLDYDRDGHLDLYTGNSALNGRDPTVRNKLYRNQGDGTFADVTAALGLDVQLHPDGGGSFGGMAAGDFNNDGWPDLYLGVYTARNRLFLSDAQGGFRDATTDEIGDEGAAFGVAVGDIDNDGDLDLFQAAGGHVPGYEGAYRSLLLQNLGAGEFADLTESAGLVGRLTEKEANHPSFGDLDNDGDLDLLIGSPHYLYLNDGTGFFTEETSRSGIVRAGFLDFAALADYDRDGFLDVCFGLALEPLGFGGLYRNQGNGNHWLEVELTGVRSNRSGIGARVIATSGTLRQTREILGGTGFTQDEMMAHFGLGGRATVDRLEIRWPSGQVDVLTDVPADQRIRVFEGESAYYTPQPTTAEFYPDTVVVGTPADLALRVVPMRFEPEARIARVVADLSALGGPSEAPLRADGEAAYSLRTSLSPTRNGLVPLSVLVDQDTRLGPRWSRLTRSVWVLPAGDLVIYDDAPAQAWTWRTEMKATLDPAATARAQQGSAAVSIQAAGVWKAYCETTGPVSRLGYTALRLSLHPGDATGRSLEIRLNGHGRKNLMGRVDWGRPTWQTVEMALDTLELEAGESIASIGLQGNLTGTFYLDDLRLVAERASAAPGTAVLEARTAAVPRAFALQPNYPNPFNSSTVIGFRLPERARVELTVYDLLGQQVATLVQGEREAGAHQVTWDGRDTAGRPLASGVYLCRLRAAGQAGGLVDTRRLLLLR
ncbi:MAG: FG-GAP-like repeat-containing protein [Candidatus Latescibacterota bacterium]